MKNAIKTIPVALAGLTFVISAPVFADPGRDSLSVHHTKDHLGNGNFWVKSDAIDLSAQWRGSFSFNEDGTDITAIDGQLEIEQKSDGDLLRVVFRGDGESVEKLFSVNDRPREIDQLAETQISQLVRKFVRESGVNADERVAQLYAAGGADAVFTEIDLITGGHAARQYLAALAETIPLSGASITHYADRASELQGDYDKRKAISAAFEHQGNLSPQDRAALLKAAQGIEGDHEIRKLMEAAVSGPLTRDAIETSMALMQRISGDHELRKGAEVLLENETVSDEAATDLLLLSGRNVESDHELRKIIETAMFRAATSNTVASAAINVAAEIESDHEKRKVVDGIASVLAKDVLGGWVSLIAVADEIQSDHEKRKALSAISDRMPRDDGLETLYRTSANSIQSDGEREKALDRLD